MEFLLYLTPINYEVYQLISKKINVVENGSICRQHDIFGWYNSKSKTMNICTDKIKSVSMDIHSTINETLLHESVHFAQSCKNSFGNILEFGIPISKMPISKDKELEINQLVSKYGKEYRHFEHEAYWMEDKEEKVTYVLKKYCF